MPSISPCPPSRGTHPDCRPWIFPGSYIVRTHNHTHCFPKEAFELVKPMLSYPVSRDIESNPGLAYPCPMYRRGHSRSGHLSKTLPALGGFV